jgi:hypothetical protein
LRFKYEEVLPRETYDRLNQARVDEPNLPEIEAEARKRRQRLCGEKLILVAADHNARMITDFDGDPLRLGNRHEFLSRVIRALSAPGVDGIEGTPDILEDVLILNALSRRAGGPDLLEDKILIGTINRGGLKRTSWEMDDRPTCFTLGRIERLRLDGAKVMFRILPEDDRSGRTLKYCADIVSEAEERGIPVFIESLYVNRVGEGYSLDTSTANLVRTVGVASALGSSSVNKWLEVPINDEYDRVALATTCPLLVVPMETGRGYEQVVAEYSKGIGAGTNVRGVLLGRNVFMAEEDPLELAAEVARLWKRGTVIGEQPETA